MGDLSGYGGGSGYGAGNGAYGQLPLAGIRSTGYGGGSGYGGRVIRKRYNSTAH